MNINKLTRTLIAASLMAASVTSTSHATPTSSLSQPAQIHKVDSNYLTLATFDPTLLFTQTGKHDLRLSLPQLGDFRVIHTETKAIDGAGKVVRWLGYVEGNQSLQVQFVRGISGNITGILDTPKGRVLLGNANGEYFFHGESADVASTNNAAPMPNILIALEEGENTNSKQNISSLKPDDNVIAYPVEFNIAGLASLSPGQDAQLSLPGTGDFVVRHDGTQPGDLGGATFVGHLKDYGDDFRILVSYSPNGAQGSILTPYGEFQLQTLGSNQWLLDISRSKLERHHTDDSDSAIPGNVGIAGGAISTGAVAAGTTSSGSTTTTTAASTTSTGKTQIDVLVLYTPGFETRYGGQGPALNRIQLLTALSNQAYTDSNVQISLRLVGAVKMEISDTTTNSATLSSMQQATGSFTNIRNLRQTYGADLVTIVRPFYATEQGGNCGVGYVGGYGGTDIASYSGFGYSVVSDGTDMNGQNLFCDNYTFAHELGHNMGSMHDRATVQSQGGGVGAYPYSYGHGQSGTFGTIMSYIRPTVGKFSSPSITCSTSNLPCGIDASNTATSADNAQSLNNTRTGISGFMAEINTLPVTVSGVVTLNNAALPNVTITPSASGASCTSSGSNGVYSCTINPGWSGNLTPSLNGYTFAPTSLSFNNLQSSVANQNFVASLNTPPEVIVPKVRISGYVYSNGKGLSGVQINGSTNTVSCSNSRSNGAYSCTVPKGWTGYLTASATGYRFSPAKALYRKVQTALINKNFSATPLPLKLKGYVRYQGKGVANVQIRGSTTGVSCGRTSSSGAFTCTVPTFWSGKLIATSNDYRFTPSSLSFSKVQAATSDNNFEATPTKAKVTGYVKSKGKGLANVLIKASSRSVTCNKTSGSGSFTCITPHDWNGTLTATLRGYSFTPNNLSLNNVQGIVRNKNFEAIKN